MSKAHPPELKKFMDKRVRNDYFLNISFIHLHYVMEQIAGHFDVEYTNTFKFLYFIKNLVNDSFFMFLFKKGIFDLY